MTTVLQTRIEDWSRAPSESKAIVRRSKILNESLTLRNGTGRSDRLERGLGTPGGWNSRLEIYWRDYERRTETGRSIYRKSSGRTRPPPTRARITHMYHTYVCVKPRITHG